MKNHKITILSIVIFLFVIFTANYFLQIKTDLLINEKYSNIADKIKSTTKDFIDAKSEANLFIALSLAHDKRYVDSIANSTKADFDLDSFSELLNKNTEFKNVWIQVSDYKGISIYRSWTKERGDDLTKVRKDMVEMIKNPKIRSTISTGIYDITFKSMVPIFKDDVYMGTIEVITKFNSIAKQLQNNGFEPVMLVDKSYKKQIKEPYTKMFVGDYYVANLNASKQNQEYIEKYGIEKLIQTKDNYIIDNQNNKFITIYKQKDINGEDMAYIVLFYPLDEISLKDIYFFQKSLLTFVFLSLLGVFLTLMLLNSRHKKEKVELQSQLLSKEVEEKNIELERQHQFLQSIINGLNESVMVIDKNYNVLLANDYAMKHSNYRITKDNQHPKCYELSHNLNSPCDRADQGCPLMDTFDKKQRVKMIHKYSGKDGKDNFVEIITTPLYDKNNEIYAVVEIGHDITDHLKIQEELRKQRNILNHQAHHDALTDLPNRVLFNDRLEQSIQMANRKNTKVAVLFLDLDHFKEINDSLGHEVGDKILKTVSRRLKEIIRKEDTVARLGGDEFTIILEELFYSQDASLVANKILESLSKAIQIEENELYISSSIGISIYPDDGSDPQSLLKFADSAMYKAKNEGRNNYQYYSSEMTELAFERVVMETAMRSGIKNEEFVVYYQPQINGLTNQLIGVEALVRWKHPTMGIVSPAKFIPLAESTGLIVELDRYVMKTAMNQVSQWYKDGLNPGVLAMNLAVKQLKQNDFIDIFQSLMEETACKSEWLELEVTETQIMSHPEEAIEILQRISDLGIELAVDDFGTGYSSLAYLKKLPINKLKIDQAFVRGLPDDEEDVGISRAVIALAKSLRLRVIAEGVETKEQRDFLVENGCENIQGYFYSKPVPANEIEKILQNGLKG